MIHLLRRAAMPLVCVAALGSCDSGPTDGGEPTPGTLKVILASPNASDAAILVQLDGVEIENVVVSGSGRVAYSRSVSGTRIKAVILGAVGTGELLRFDVPDTRRRTSYTASVLQVSDDANTLRAALTGYTLQIQP